MEASLIEAELKSATEYSAGSTTETVTDIYKVSKNLENFQFESQGANRPKASLRRDSKS